MVTQMNKASKNEARANGSETSNEKTNETGREINTEGTGTVETKEFASELKTGNALVDKAVNARSESMVLLSEAAATAVFFYAKHGRTELMNRLFNGLLRSKSAIDAQAFKTLYVLRLIDLFGVGGIRELDEAGLETDRWEKRNTNFVAYSTNPKNEGEHWTPAFYKGENADAKNEHVKQAKRNIVEAGIEGLQAIDWISREKIAREEPVYNLGAFQNRLAKELLRAAKAGLIVPASIRVIAREVGMKKADYAPIVNAYRPDEDDEDETENQSTNQTEIPENHPSQQQAA